MTNANVTLSPYERAVNILNELTPRQDTIISAALDTLRAALATAQAERSEWEEKWAAANAYSDTLIEAKNRAQAERDAALQRAEQAEAALAQAQAERDEAQCQIPTEQPPDRLKQGRLILNGYGRTCYLAGIETGKREAAEAQPPALPPLPEGWVEKHVNGKRTEAEVRFTYLDEGGCDVQIYAMADAVRFWQVGTVPSVADLITVLRHAERAHQRLKEGQ